MGPWVSRGGFSQVRVEGFVPGGVLWAGVVLEQRRGGVGPVGGVPDPALQVESRGGF